MTYQVGQVLYVLSGASMRVFPIQVAEQIVRRTVEGEQTSYLISSPNGEVKTLPLEKIKGKIFISLADARNEMESNASKAIAQVIAKAQKIAEKSYGIASDFVQDSLELYDADVIAEPAKKLSKKKTIMKESDPMVVTLPDGSKAKVNLPTSVDDALSPMQN